MALSSQLSFILSTLLVILLFSGMQANKQWLSATMSRTILSGFFGSLLFIFSLTSIGNIESLCFGKDFQTKLFPEVALCLSITMFTSALIHRVTVTSSILFSGLALYYMNSISNKVYSTPNQPKAPVVASSGKKRKH